MLGGKRRLRYWELGGRIKLTGASGGKETTSDRHVPYAFREGTCPMKNSRMASGPKRSERRGCYQGIKSAAKNSRKRSGLEKKVDWDERVVPSLRIIRHELINPRLAKVVGGAMSRHEGNHSSQRHRVG